MAGGRGRFGLVGNWKNMPSKHVVEERSFDIEGGGCLVTWNLSHFKLDPRSLNLILAHAPSRMCTHFSQQHK